MAWLKYFVAFAIGIAAIYFLAPIVSERISGNANDPFFTEGDWEDAGEAPKPPPGVSLGGLRKIDISRRSAAASDGGPAPDGAAEAGAAARTAAAEVEQEVIIIDEPPPMSLDEIPQSPGEVVRWGVLSLNAPAYRKDGTRLETPAPGGTLVEISKLTFSSKGEELALCRAWGDGEWTAPVLIPTASIAMFAGTRAGVLAEDLRSLMEYCRINAALSARKATLEREAADANPYAAEIRRLAAENKSLSAKAADLRKRRDAASGAVRAALADELRAIVAKSTSVSAELKDKIPRYEKWKADHPVVVADTSSDPEWMELKARLDAAAPAVEMFGLADAPARVYREEELPDE